MMPISGGGGPAGENKWIPTLTLSYLMWTLSAHQFCALAGPVNTSNVGDAWLLEHVVPNIQSRLNGDIAKVLARALLWAAFDNEVSVYVPTEIRNHIQLSYLLVPDGLANENPVKKV